MRFTTSIPSMARPGDGSDEFGWVARRRGQPEQPPVRQEVAAVGGLTLGHRRALVATGVAALVVAAVLSAAAGLRLGARFGGEVAAPTSSSSTIGSAGQARITTTLGVARSVPESLTSTVEPSPFEPATADTPTTTARAGSSATSTLKPPTTRTQATKPPATRVPATAAPSTVAPTSRGSVSEVATVPPAAGRTPGIAVQTSAAATTRPPTTRPTTTELATTRLTTTELATTELATTTATAPVRVPTTAVATTTSTRPAPAGVENGGIVVEPSGSVTLTDVIFDGAGDPVSGVTVDLFKVNSNNRRAGFVASAETDDAGRYRLAASLDSDSVSGGSAPVLTTDCLISVFAAPTGMTFEETGRFREALVCPTEGGAELPQVRLLPEAEQDRSAAESRPRSVLASGGKFYLRGAASNASEATALAQRYQWSIGSARVVSGYCCVAGASANGSQATTEPPAGEERISLDSALAHAFEPGSAELSPESLFITRQVATVLKWNPTARLRIVVAVDPMMDEQPTPALLTARQKAVIKGLGTGIAADRVEVEALSTVTDGRRLGGRSISSQLEFVLLWS
ncbi:MAG: hypothetical protein ACRBK7_05165 [Acidimicrobiales bacterium]